MSAVVSDQRLVEAVQAGDDMLDHRARVAQWPAQPRYGWWRSVNAELDPRLPRPGRH